MHANTDEDGFVKKTTYTTGNVHDSKEFDNQKNIFADEAVLSIGKILTNAKGAQAS
jgi:hypothetical protein